jgi:hypothetical protein
MNVLALEEHEAEAPAGLGLAELRALRAGALEALEALLEILGKRREEVSPRWCHAKHALLAAMHAFELAGMLSGENPDLSGRLLDLSRELLELAERLLAGKA